MKKLFSGFYRPTNSEFRKLWDTGTFVIDANVLLNLHRYPDTARKDLFKVLGKVKERIWVPYHAALEFARNRLEVIGAQHKKFSDVRKVLDDAERELETGLNNLQLGKRHANIDPTSFLESVKKLFDEFKGNLSRAEEKHVDVYDEDKVREDLDVLLDGKIGPPLSNQAEIDAICQEGESRYKNKIPPGFMDWEKGKGTEPKEFSYGGLSFRRAYGDLILWKQIIQHAKEEEVKAVVLVTDDTKEDWWLIVSSKGPKTIGPRPELIDEIRREAGVEIFHMYNSEQFMKMAEHYLNVQVREESINQVRDLSIRHMHRVPPVSELQVFRGIVSWIQR